MALRLVWISTRSDPPKGSRVFHTEHGCMLHAPGGQVRAVLDDLLALGARKCKLCVRRDAAEPDAWREDFTIYELKVNSDA